jgi:hypothetical protein
VREQLGMLPEKESQPVIKKSLCAALLALATATVPALVGTPAHAAPGQTLVCDNHRNHPYTGTYKQVTVPRGASCYLRNAHVLGNLKALHGAVDVLVINTAVDRNIHIKGATRDVKIGPRHCRFDPTVGNNIIVTRSHNVAICFSTVKDNISVTRNDGRIMLRDNEVGKNIRVVDNLPYVHQPGDGQHPQMDAIRLRDNKAGRHITVKRNNGRPLVADGNSPAVNS